MLIDDRAGSKQFIKWLDPATLARLSYGDVSFMGEGPDGRPVPIGIELKQLSDVLKCITDGRFSSHQLPGLRASYEVVYLVFYGPYKCDLETGTLLVPRQGDWKTAHIGSRGFMYRELDSWLSSIELRGGVRIRRTWNVREAATVCQSLFSWWGKEWDKHRAHAELQDVVLEQVMLLPPTLLRKIAAQLPGVGWKRSRDVSTHFNSVLEMVLASSEEWQSIQGIGKVIANKVIKAIGG